MTEWVMVPREPTEQMLVALANTPCRVGWPAKAYRAMLDAAPAAPVQPVQAQGEPVEIVPRVWREALRKLTFMARTSGGSAVPDKELQAACAQAEALLSKPYNYPPAAPQQAGQFDHLAGRGIHELRTGELPAYIVSLAVGHGPSSPVVKAALDWIVSELERKTNDERALAVKLDAIRAAPQQAEPVSYAVFDPSGEAVYAALFETRCIEYRDNEYRYGHSAAKHWAVRPVFAHPPAAEVQRLRDAAMAVVDAYRNIGPVTVAIEDLSRALEGK